MSPEQTTPTAAPTAPDDKPAEQTNQTEAAAKTFDAASVYPTPSEHTEPQNKPAVPALNFSSSRFRRDGTFALIGGAGSVLVTLVLVFAGNLFSFGGGEFGFIMQMLFIGSLALAGLIFGYKAVKSQSDDMASGIIGIALGAVMFVVVLFMASYYIKLKIELNKLQRQFNSSINSRSTIID